MTRTFLTLLVFGFSFTLAGCGLSPVYGKYADGNVSAPVAAALSDIYIGSIPNREGQQLRNLLIDRLVKDGQNGKAESTYKLAFGSIAESIYGIGIAKDATATRSQIRLTVRFTLQDTRQPGSDPMLIRTVTGVSSFNTLASQYTTLVTEEDARQQTINQLAEQIVLQLELYFSNPSAFPKGPNEADVQGH